MTLDFNSPHERKHTVASRINYDHPTRRQDNCDTHFRRSSRRPVTRPILALSSGPHHRLLGRLGGPTGNAVYRVLDVFVSATAVCPSPSDSQPGRFVLILCIAQRAAAITLEGPKVGIGPTAIKGLLGWRTQLPWVVVDEALMAGAHGPFLGIVNVACQYAGGQHYISR